MTPFDDMTKTVVTSPTDALLDELCLKLGELAPQLEQADAWPAEQLQLCADYGVFEWFLPIEMGGQGWSEFDIVRGYLKLSAACLTTTFIITQRMGACRRLAVSDNRVLAEQWLPGLIKGETFATVGISHLTTSRRHLSKPILTAEKTESGFLLNGFSPWVTGSAHADMVVVGATLADSRQFLAVVETNLAGVEIPPTADLVGLSASQTGPVRFTDTLIPADALIAGPVENVMQAGAGARTGGLQTSTLAIGLADAAIAIVEQEATKREDLAIVAKSLREEHAAVEADLLALASGETVCSNDELRTRANSLALRTSQASLTATKGAGYLTSHPAGRYCREALFFLVWSCPQSVLAANLCELAGISD